VQPLHLLLKIIKIFAGKLNYNPDIRQFQHCKGMDSIAHVEQKHKYVLKKVLLELESDFQQSAKHMLTSKWPSNLS
jgi:hydroxyacyl-ACP dehydratase HTD2-like protein with hotdog domain